MDSHMSTDQLQSQLAELPFLVIATALARDTELCDEEISAAERGLNSLDLQELMEAVHAGEHSATELFELAWLDDDVEESVAARTGLLVELFGPVRSAELRSELLTLARLVSSASDRPLRGRERAEWVERVQLALRLDA